MDLEIKSDLHIHSQFSDGKLSIKEIVDLYGNRGFGAIAVTDHLCEKSNIVGRVSHSLNLSLSESTFPLYMNTIRREAERAWKVYRMLLIPGYEITKNSFVNKRSAHILVLGIDEFISPDQPVVDILAIAKAKGALTIAAHPFYTGDFCESSCDIGASVYSNFFWIPTNRRSRVFACASLRSCRC